jgi:hypothetical protein
MSFNAVGKVWSETSFREYLATLKRPQWNPKAITLHHTASPSLEMRPVGLTAQHITNIRNYYKGLGWNSGPHLFSDENDIFGMTPLNEKGVHAKSFNSTAIGIEVLGDYDREDPLSGRGLECWTTAAAATKALVDWLGLPINNSTILFHRDDPRTSKTCPGTKVLKPWFIDLLRKKAPIKPTVPDENTVEEPGDTLQPVGQWLVENRGYSWDQIKGKLHTKAGMFYYFGEEWLEGARYDAKVKTTVAPLSELQGIPHA